MLKLTLKILKKNFAMFSVASILIGYQNSDKILLGKQNSKQNFDCDTRIDIDNDVCMKQNSANESEL